MKICMLMKDFEYCHILAETIGKYGKNIVVEIAGNIDKDSKFDIILTDIDMDYSAIKSTTFICLTDNPNDDLPKDYSGGSIKLFKYKSISNILSDIEHIHFVNTGKLSSYGLNSRIIAVCSDFYDKRAHLSQIIAKQLYSKRGLETLVLPLSYQNNYPCIDEGDSSKFSRWMYYIDADKNYSLDYFTYCDSFGINYLKLPPGINPLAFLNESNIMKLIMEMSHIKYEAIILDISNCYSELNISLLKKADNIAFFYEDDNKLIIDDLIKDEEHINKLEKICIYNCYSDVDLIIDGYVTKLIEEKGSGEIED